MGPQTSAGLSMGVGTVGSLLSGLGQRAQGKQEQAAYNYNADITLLNMDDELVANQQRYTTLIGKQATAYAASGVDITRGSPLLMMAATAGRGGRQAEQIRQAATEEATLERYYGKVAAWRGTMSGIGTFLSGMSRSAAAYEVAMGNIPNADIDLTDTTVYNPTGGIAGAGATTPDWGLIFGNH